MSENLVTLCIPQTPWSYAQEKSTNPREIQYGNIPIILIQIMMILFVVLPGTRFHHPEYQRWLDTKNRHVAEFGANIYIKIPSLNPKID